MRLWPALLLFAGACSEEPESTVSPQAEGAPGSTSAPSTDSSPRESPGAGLLESEHHFVDVTEASGLGSFRQVCGGADKPFIVETIGAGVALVDVDQDGDLDAYLTNGSFFGATEEDAPRDALYLNDGSGVFTDASAESGIGDQGWTCGVRVADYDADGLPDLYLTNYGPNVLLRNTGGGKFEDVTEATGVGDPAWSTGAAFLDFDRDGDLDLYVSNYVDFDEEEMLRERPTVSYQNIDVMKGPRGLPEAYDTFYINEGGVFRDASEELGIRTKRLFSFQVVAFDADRDGWVDLYVANDSVENVLWRNDEGRGFEDVAFLSGLAFSLSGKPQAGMGVSVGDYDEDLHADLYVTNFADDYFTLYRGTARNYFVDATHRLRLAELTKPSLGWGCGFEDFDADGRPELYVANGHVYPQVDQFDIGLGYKQRNLLLEYDGKSFVGVKGGPGFELMRGSRGSATGDIDGDGDRDLLFGNLDDAPTLLRNDSETGGSIEIFLVGQGGNRDAVGARVVVTVGERKVLRLPATASGFLSSNAPGLFVGLGEASAVDAIEVTWPNGTHEVLPGVPAGTVVTIEEGLGEEGRSRVRTASR